MAHFLARIKGQRGEASRLGSKASGMHADVASWQGAVSVRLYHDAETGKDMADVSLIPWHGAGTSRSLYHGPVSGCVENLSVAQMISPETVRRATQRREG